MKLASLFWFVTMCRVTAQLMSWKRTFRISQFSDWRPTRLCQIQSRTSDAKMKSHVKRHMRVLAVARPVGEQWLQYVKQNIDKCNGDHKSSGLRKMLPTCARLFLKLCCTTRIWLQTFLCILNKIYLETDELNL